MQQLDKVSRGGRERMRWKGRERDEGLEMSGNSRLKLFHLKNDVSLALWVT